MNALGTAMAVGALGGVTIRCAAITVTRSTRPRPRRAIRLADARDAERGVDGSIDASTP